MAGIGPTGSSLGAARVRVRAATPPVTASIPATTSAPSANGTLRSGRAPWVIGGVVLAGVAAAALATWLIRRDRSGDGPGPGPGTDPEPLPDQLISVGQLNAYNLFDTVDDPKKQDDVATPAEYDLHLRKLALTLRDGMGAPDVVTLQEVENEQVLRDLVARPEIAALGYVPVLREGRDPRGIDVAVLYRGDRLAEASVATWDTDGVSPSGRKQKDFTRPPLVVELTPRGGADGAQAGARSITAVALHLTSRLQGTDGERRRSQQAASVAGQVDALRASEPSRLVVLGGDLNMAPGEAPYDALVGQRLLAPLDAVDAAERYSYRRGSTRELLDHVLVTPTDGVTTRSASIPHINTSATAAQRRDADTAAGTSDHDPVVVQLALRR